VHEHEGRLQFAGPSRRRARWRLLSVMSAGRERPRAHVRADAADAPPKPACVSSIRRRDIVSAWSRAPPRSPGRGIATFDAPICLDPVIAEDAARGCCPNMADVEIVHVMLPPSLLALGAGDRVSFDQPGAAASSVCLSIESARRR